MDSLSCRVVDKKCCQNGKGVVGVGDPGTKEIHSMRPRDAWKREGCVRTMLRTFSGTIMWKGAPRRGKVVDTVSERVESTIWEEMTINSRD